MTKTIKRSLIAIMMLVFAVSTVFTAAYAVKADETQDPAAVAAESFASIVASWDGKVDFEEEINILTMIGEQYLIDSAASAREMYADGKAVIDADYKAELAKYNVVMAACKDALDFVAQVNELNENLKVTSKVVIFGSEEIYVNGLETKLAGLDAAEATYVNSKFVNETAEEIIDAVQAKITAIHAAGAEAEVAIADIQTFDGEALLASGESLFAAIEKLTAIYGKAIEEIFAMDVRVNGDVYKEDATKVASYVANIATYVELKTEYDAQVAIAQEVIDAIDGALKKVDADRNDGVKYIYINNEELIADVVEAFELLDNSAENDLQAYVTERAGDVYNGLLEGIYNDEIQYVVDLVLALPEADEAGIIPLKDALDNYRAKFEALEDAQKVAVNATLIAEDSEYAEYETIKAMYEYYNEKSTQPWAMVQYAITAIDAIELNADGEFVMSVETVAQLVNAQQKYANVPEDYKKYVTNSDKLFACAAKMEEDLVAVKDWAKQVVAIAENAPITVTNWKDVEAAVATFTEDILEEIQGYIENEEAFRAFILTDVEGVEEDQAIQYYFDLFVSEVASTMILFNAVDAIAVTMYYSIDVVTDLTLDYDFVDLPDWIDFVDYVEFQYTETLVLSEEDWEDMLSGSGMDLPYIGIAYGDDSRAYLAEGYGAYLKAQYDAAEEADKVDYEYYNFFENYTNALAIRERYQVELAIEALVDAADITIVDEYDLLVVRSYFEALDEENEDVLCGQDSVRNIEKLEACEEALKVITDKLDAFVAAVKALGDDATKLDLVAYQAAQDIRLTLTADELNYTGVYPSISMLAEGEADGIDFARDVDAAVVKIDELRETAIENINDLVEALKNVTGNGEEFVALYDAYMALHTSQRDSNNEAILAPDASIVELREAYRYAGTLANTDWINSVDERLDDVKAELEDAIAVLEDESATKEALQAAIDTINGAIADEVEALEDALADLDEEFAGALADEVEAIEGKIAALKTELEGKISTLESKLQAAIDKEIADREAADKALQEQIDSTRTLAIVGLVIAIVGLCAAAFVIVYKVILKK